MKHLKNYELFVNENYIINEGFNFEELKKNFQSNLQGIMNWLNKNSNIKDKLVKKLEPFKNCKTVQDVIETSKSLSSGTATTNTPTVNPTPVGESIDWNKLKSSITGSAGKVISGIGDAVAVVGALGYFIQTILIQSNAVNISQEVLDKMGGAEGAAFGAGVILMLVGAIVKAKQA